jgi:hypothetical protein
MTETHKRFTEDYVLGLLIGIGCGVAVGVLLAPAPGRDSREWILARGRATRHRTAAFLHLHGAMDIMRRRGAIGLLDFLQRREKGEAAGTDQASPPAGTAESAHAAEAQIRARETG